MRQTLSMKTIMNILVDVGHALLLALYGLLIGPLGLLRGPLAFERVVWYLWVLVPQRILSRAIHGAIDWRMGSFDSAIVHFEALVSSTEQYVKQKKRSRIRRHVLEDLYTILARAYLNSGRVDDAMLVLIRAKKSLGIERLSGLAELDAKTAHLVRAGLAAGRLLDGNGLATMFVKSNKESPNIFRRQGATKNDASESQKSSQNSEEDLDEGLGGKVIPLFPDANQTPDNL